MANYLWPTTSWTSTARAMKLLSATLNPMCSGSATRIRRRFADVSRTLSPNRTFSNNIFDEDFGKYDCGNRTAMLTYSMIILEYLYKNPDLNLIGQKEIIYKNRAPTISFTSKTKSSKEISEKLVHKKIATRNDNFYAWRL